MNSLLLPYVRSQVVGPVIASYERLMNTAPGVFGTHWASGSNQWPSGRFDLRGSALCSPVPMFPGTYVPRTYVPRYLCSPVPMFPGTDVPRTYVSRYLCSPVPMFTEPMFPDLLQMCCRAYVRRPSDRHWNWRAAKRKNVTQNVTN